MWGSLGHPACVVHIFNRPLSYRPVILVIAVPSCSFRGSLVRYISLLCASSPPWITHPTPPVEIIYNLGGATHHIYATSPYLHSQLDIVKHEEHSLYRCYWYVLLLGCQRSIALTVFTAVRLYWRHRPRPPGRASQTIRLQDNSLRSFGRKGPGLQRFGVRDGPWIPRR